MNFGHSPGVKLLKSSQHENRSKRLKRMSHLSGGSPAPQPLSSTEPLRNRIKIEYENRYNEYHFSVNLYTVPPFGQLKLEEAQEAVQERLTVLNVLEDVKAAQAAAPKASDFNRTKELTARFKALGPKVFVNELNGGKDNPAVQAARKKDHVSHFLLRMLCCQHESMKKWFIQKEVEFLRYRLESEKNTLDLVNLLAYNNMNFEEVGMKEKQLLIKQHKINYANQTMQASSVFYKIPFEEALELVRNRRVFLAGGYCYCSVNEMFTIIAAKFRLDLSRMLANLYNAMPHLDENNRLTPIFERIYGNMVKARKSNRAEQEGNKEQITPDMIDELAEKHFPPCMRNTHELLRLNHHLKHYGRLYYGLFLKGIGLGLEDALTFFRDEFIQNMTPDRFAKSYSYNIQYNYGKLGKRVNLSGYKCLKIQNENPPGTGDAHGCPFKHYDANHLAKMLKKHSVDEENSQMIADLVKDAKYSAACSNYFACKHGGIRPPQEIYHPNQYYRESRKIAKGILPPPPQSQENASPENASPENGDPENASPENGDKEDANSADSPSFHVDPAQLEGMDFDDIDEGSDEF